MKNTVITLLLLLATVAHAQQKIPVIDKSKATAVIHASNIMTAHGEFINPPSADMVWKPMLVNINQKIENDAPNEKLLDSLNQINVNRKLQYRDKNLGEKTTAVYPAIGSNFVGNSSDGATPLDNTMAISNGGIIVSCTNRKIEYYNTSGTLTWWSPITSFLPASFTVSEVCDPYVFYDYNADRFIFFCQELNSSGVLFNGNRIIVCFSKTNDPSAGWWAYWLTGDPTGSGYAFDYPKLAVNDSEVFITGNLFNVPAVASVKSTIFQMNKLQAYAGAASVNYVFYPYPLPTTITGNPFTLLPVSWGQSGDIQTTMLFVSTENSGGNSINFYQIVGNNCCSPNLYQYSTTTTPYITPSDANQSGTSQVLKIRDCRALSGFYLDSIIHFVFSSGNPSTSWDEVNYNRLNVVTGVNASSTFGLAGLDYCYPSVASFATVPTDKSVMIAFGRSSPSIYPEIRVVNCDNSMTWSSSTLVRSGDSYVDYGYGTPDRWGDYNGTSRKHNSATPSIWLSGSYGNTSNTWTTWIAEVHSGGTAIVNETTKENDVKIYPNPVKTKFSVQFTINENTSIGISLYDATGKLVKELYSGNANIGLNVFSFDKANLSSGIYFLTIKSSTNIIKNEKIVISD